MRSLPSRCLSCVRSWFWVALIGFATPPTSPAAGVETELTLVDGVIVRFASVEQGATQLEKPDRFLTSLSQFDRQSRLNTNEDVTSDDVADFAASQVVPWQDDEIAKLSAIIERIREKFSGYHLPFPKTVLMIKTTGREEGDAAYCRTNSVVLPRRIVGAQPAGLERTMTHELFHVLSSHNPDLRRRLYKVIGFKPCNPISLPATLRDRKLTNPDGPVVEDYIELQVDGTTRPAVPILFASAERYDPTRGQSFFRYLTFRLMLIELNGNRWQATERDGEPVLLDPQTTESFHAQIGKNTRYIIHPDEILADNFVHLIHETQGLATPRIVVEMEKLLSKSEPGT